MNEELIAALEMCFEKGPEEAIKYLKSQGIDTSWDWKDAIKRIKDHSFTIAKVASADMLQTVHDELAKAIDDGIEYATFKKNASTMMESRGWDYKSDGSAFRWDLIYRMNLQSAYQQGKFWEMEDAAETHPYRQFVAVQDRRTTSGCLTLDNAIFHYRDPMYLTNQTPRHFNCRSTWIALTADQAGKDIKTKADFPNLHPEEGFGLNPLDGEYKPDTNKYFDELKVYVDEEIP